MSEGAQVLGLHLLDHALEYAAAGLAVFPVNPRTKAPMSEPTSQKHATTNPNLVGDWWERWPTALIGHRLPRSQVVTDIDPRHQGHETWRALKGAVGELPTTRVHASGRGDGGAHLWWQHPGEKLNIRGLDLWAKERGLGHAVEDSSRWVSGIDLLQHDHRYTILPPSPHPDTGQPYRWVDGRGLQVEPAPMPALLLELLVEPERPAVVAAPVTAQEDSIADWFSAHSSWVSLLAPFGWQLVRGSGDEDGSQWRHPSATSAVSATVKHGCLFVYTPNTPFEVTDPGDPHGYTRFAAYALLQHGGDQSSAARAAREQGPVREHLDVAALVGAPRAVASQEPVSYIDPDLDTFLAESDDDYDWLVPGLLERGDRTIITGPEGGGKSTLLRQMAIQLACGIHPFTLDPIDPVQVLLVDCENSARQARRALRPLRDAAGDSYASGHLRMRVLGHSIELAKPAVLADIGARIEAQQVDVLLIGPLYKLLDDDPLKELPAKAVADAIDWLRGLRQSAVLLEAHTPYAEGHGKGRPMRPYGASLWSRWPEFGIYIEGGPTAPKDKVGTISHWRGQRDERAWPTTLEHSSPWPWAPRHGATEEPAPWDGPTQCVEAVVAFINDVGGDYSLRQLGDRLRERGVSYRDDTVRTAARMAEAAGRISVRNGARGALIYSPAAAGLGVLALEEEF